MLNKIKNRYIVILLLQVLAIISYTDCLFAQDVPVKDENDYIVRIKKEYDKGNWEAGKKIADENMKKNPKDSDIRMLIGKYYLQLKQYDKARYELQKALEINPNNVGAKQILVNVETESKRYSSAICYVNELLEVNPYWRGLWLKKIELYRLQGNTIEANRLSRRINQIYPQDSILKRSYLYETEMEAITKQKSGKIDEAIALRMELINKEPRKHEHYIGLADDYIKAGDIRNALIYTERGLSYAPDNMELINKKVGLLAEQKQYAALLNFLQQKMQKENLSSLRSQYNYYLAEAAREARENESATLYRKVLDTKPGDEQAFNHVFNSLYATYQYEEALNVISKYRRARGESKDLLMKELSIHTRLGNTGRVLSLTEQLLAKYPNDTDLKESYAKLLLEEAKIKMSEERFGEAIVYLKKVLVYGDADIVKVGQSVFYNAAIAKGDYATALEMVNSLIAADSGSAELYIKKAEVYQKMKQYDKSLTAYEEALSSAHETERQYYLGGYAELLMAVIKDLEETYRHGEALNYAERWIQKDPTNTEAIKYAVNLLYKMNRPDEAYMYVRKGHDLQTHDIFFKTKLAERDLADSSKLPLLYTSLLQDLKEWPYHKDLVNTFEQTCEDYGKLLIKEKKYSEGLDVVETGLRYSVHSKPLKYMKGVAYEKLNQFDSAYYYQSFYEPSPLEVAEFKQQLNYLQYKKHRNEIGFYHLYSRHGDQDVINSISTIEYSRYGKRNTYTGRVNYSGMDTGKAYQLQAEWSHIWNERTYTRIDAAWASKKFPKIAINASVYREFNIFGGLEAELGAGYKRLPGEENLSNLKIGAGKDLDSWRLNLVFNNFILNYEEEKNIAVHTVRKENKTKWLYNLSGQVRYNLTSPKNYLMGMAGVGTSPDVDLINYQLYEGFSGVNTMVGAGMGYLIFKNVSTGIIGTWYNYKVDKNNYKNLYNIYLNINVAF